MVSEIIKSCLPIIMVFGVLGVIMILRGLSYYRRDHLTPHMTAVEINRLRREYEERIQEMKDSI